MLHEIEPASLQTSLTFTVDSDEVWHSHTLLLLPNFFFCSGAPSDIFVLVDFALDQASPLEPEAHRRHLRSNRPLLLLLETIEAAVPTIKLLSSFWFLS
jgi:hypothetical protein